METIDRARLDGYFRRIGELFPAHAQAAGSHIPVCRYRVAAHSHPVKDVPLYTE